MYWLIYLEKMEETPEVANTARKLVEEYVNKYPDVSIHPSGFVFLNNAFVENLCKIWQN